MRIAELKIQPNWILTVVAEDGRVGQFDVSTYLQDEAFEALQNQMNSQKLSMVVTLLNGTVVQIRPQIPLRRDGVLLAIQICNNDRYLIRSTRNKAPTHLLIIDENFRDRPRFKTDRIRNY